MTAFWLKYGKTIAVVTGSLITFLATYYSHTSWWPLVLAVGGLFTSGGVYYAPANKDQGTLLDTDAAGAGLS